ncbi:DUF1192 domain-containing protein [Aestuariivirga sp.]|uniref:DUF1192 domain-containing protein n=1 Tax=Aestuariivirga sp. TaxID=2650926 RepID=UPI0039E6F3F6
MDLDDLPKPAPKLTVGEPLDTISVAELEQRILAFEGEIARLKAEIAKKKASKAAADAFFKS